jgi:hypothetical protein
MSSLTDKHLTQKFKSTLSNPKKFEDQVSGAFKCKLNKKQKKINNGDNIEINDYNEITQPQRNSKEEIKEDKIAEDGSCIQNCKCIIY